VINEVMPNPESDVYDEWIEIYNPENMILNLSNWNIEDNSPNNSNEITCYNIGNCSLITNSTYFIVIGKNANITRITNKNITYFYVDSTCIGNKLNNNGDIIIFYKSSYSTNFSYNYSEKGNSFAGFPDGSTDFTLCSTPTPGEKNNCSSSSEEEPKTDAELNLKISLNKNFFSIGDKVTVIGNITNTFNTTINGTLSIKFKRIDMDTYPSDWIIINQNLPIHIDVTNLSDIVDNLTWSIPENTLAGEYKCYARFNLDESSKNKTGKSYIISTAFFNYAGIGNIFIDSWNISSLNLAINDTLNATIIVTNNESKPYNVSAYMIIEKLKTATGGESNEVIYCNTTSIMNNTSHSITCNWTVPHDSITQIVKIYSKIIFNVGEEMIEKLGEKKTIDIVGLPDLGEPKFELKTSELNILFNSFSIAHTVFSSGNYNQDFKFVCYGYPKKVLADLNGAKITSDFCNKNTAILINAQRNKTYNIFIPVFAYPNCDEYYSMGQYSGYCRLCKYNPNENKWEYYSSHSNYKSEFTININGQNECQTKIITQSSGCSENYEESAQANSQYIFEKVIAPQLAKRNEKINISFTLKNTESKTKICTVKSYIYLLQKTANIGGWSPNEKEISLEAYESKKIILENTIKEDIEEGLYNYRIRITDEATGKKTDSTSGIEIKGILKQNESTGSGIKTQKPTQYNEAELDCSNTEDKIKVVLKNRHEQEINFTLHVFGLMEKEKTYSIKRQKTLYFNNKNAESKIFFIAEYVFENEKKYIACALLPGKANETGIFEDIPLPEYNAPLMQENKITGRIIHVKKKGIINTFADWIKMIFISLK